MEIEVTVEDVIQQMRTSADNLRKGATRLYSSNEEALMLDAYADSIEEAFKRERMAK